MDESRMANVGVVELFVRTIGPDAAPEPPLVVIHGGPSWDHSYLLPGLRRVAESRRVLLFDLRGCGRSSRDLGPEAYQPEYVVEDLARLLATLGDGAVDVLGFSTGGQVAQLFAEAHPERIRRLVLASTTAYPDIAGYLEGWTEYEQRVEAQPGVAPGMDDLETTIAWAFNTASTSIWNLDFLDSYNELLRGVRFSGDWLAPYLAGSLHPWRPGDPEAVLRDLGRPVLILHGAQDMGFHVRAAHRLHAAVPDSALHVIEQAGHMAQFEQPAEWARAVLDFLSAP